MKEVPDGTYKIDKVEFMATSRKKVSAYALGRNFLINKEKVAPPKTEWDEILILDNDAKGIVREPNVKGDVNKRLVGWYKISKVEPSEIHIENRETTVTNWRGNFTEEYSKGDYVKLHRKIRKHVPTT